MNKIKLNISNLHYNSKPEGDIAKKVFANIIKESNRNIEISYDEFIEKILNGHTFTPMVINTPIMINPEINEKLIVTTNEYNENKNKFIKQYKIKQWECNNTIVRRQEICWTSQDLLVLDFDDGIDEKTILIRCKELNIKPFWLYDSFSSTSQHKKFRLLFRIDKTITDFRIAKLLINSLMILFPECDKQCKDMARIFWGTNKVKYNLYSGFYKPDFTVSFEEIMKALHVHYKNKDSAHYARNIAEFAFSNGIFLSKNNQILFSTEDIKKETIENCKDLCKYKDLNIPYAFTEIEMKYNGYTKTQIRSMTDKNTVKTMYLSEGNYNVYTIPINEIKNKCKLLNEACNANYELGHQEYFKIMQLLSHVKGGDSEFIDIVNNNYEINKNKGNVFNPETMMNEYSYIKTKGYNIPLCNSDSDSGSCIYCDKCVHGKTPLSFFNINKDTIEKIVDNYGTSTIDECYIETETEINSFLNNKQPEHVVINAPTGCGKTEAYVNLCKSNDIIAVPTHKLAQEVVERIEQQGKSVIYARKRPNLPNEHDNNIYNNLLFKQLIKKASSFYKNKVEEMKKYQITDVEQDCINWIKEQDILYSTSDIIVCTHHKLKIILSKNKNIKNVIIDEDPISNILITDTTIDWKDIKIFKNHVEWEGSLTDLDSVKDIIMDLNKTIKQKPHVIYYDGFNSIKKEQQNEILEICNACKINTPVNKLFIDDRDEIFMDDVFMGMKILPEYNANKIDKLHIVNKTGFSKKLNVCILSATIPQKIAELINFKYIDNNFNYNTDSIKLYFNDTYSKTSLERMVKNGKNSSELKYMKNVIGNIPVITFKTMKQKLSNLGFNVEPTIHFGNTEGIDTLNGKDIAVVGTFHANPIKYEILAAAWNIDLSLKTMHNKKIFRNGYEFLFYTYDNEELAEIQLYSIESDLVQAIGRARTYRNNANVYVFSNLPIKGCKIMK